MKIQEAKKLINYLLDNNLKLIEEGQHKISINLEGKPGIGKTAILKEIAKERGAKYVRIELGSLEETGDILGIPVKEYNMISPDGEEEWVVEKLINEKIQLGYKICTNCTPRMNYAIPSWVPKDEEQEVLVVMDDYNRGNSLFMQAIMSLIQFNEYISWKLPKKCHLLLTSNPDDGSNNITMVDNAQQTRMLTINIDFDYEQYGRWLEQQHVISPLINFELLHPEIFEQSEKINARTYTMFANALYSIPNLNSNESMNFISYIARSCFGPDSTIGELFITFINNKLDKLMDAKSIINGTWEDTKTKIKENVFKDGEYRADIASVLTIRLINYIELLENPDSKLVDKIVNRINDIVTCDEVLLTEDLIFNLIANINQNPKFTKKCIKLLMNPKVQTKILL